MIHLLLPAGTPPPKLRPSIHNTAAGIWLFLSAKFQNVFHPAAVNAGYSQTTQIAKPLFWKGKTRYRLHFATIIQ